jgi:diguanylate cyclase
MIEPDYRSRGGKILSAIAAEQNAWTRARDFVFPPVSEEIRAALEHAQFESIRQQVPMLLAVAALNVMIVMAVCAHDGLPLRTYGWMSGLVVYCAVRAFYLRRRMAQPVTAEQVRRMPKATAALALIMISGLSMVTCFTFMTGVFSFEILIPVSLAFGATSISHCLYTLRPAAIGMLVMGIMPPAAAMIVAGSFQTVMLGTAMMSVAILMIRFVSAQYDQLVASLFLEKQIRDLANTDALTGLANRRAIMAALDTEATYGPRFGVALLDLDGFKGVNDTHGHHAGDVLLEHVAARLTGAKQPLDSVGRLGGDEFIVIYRDVHGANDIDVRSAAILAALCQPVDIGDHMIPLAASLGSATFLESGGKIAEMLIAADKALYAHKRVNKETVVPHARQAA